MNNSLNSHFPVIGNLTTNSRINTGIFHGTYWVEIPDGPQAELVLQPLQELSAGYTDISFQLFQGSLKFENGKHTSWNVQESSYCRVSYVCVLKEAGKIICYYVVDGVFTVIVFTCHNLKGLTDLFTHIFKYGASQVVLVVKIPPTNAGGRSPGGGCGNPLQYSCLENTMDREAWRTTVHRVAKSWTWLNWLRTDAHIYIWM